MNNINLLSGLDFEELCKTLLQRLGFQVETTKQSGDGGIDLIAYCNRPMLKGKHIVQCKRYAGGVGEPIVRDLYGVVMAERANKGILITTGYFTLSAAKFASDKNLELIDGEQLNELLFTNDLLSEISPMAAQSFESFSSFDREKFNFYKSMINQNMCTIKMGSDFLFSFLFDYFSNEKTLANPETLDIIHNGLAKEYMHIFDWYINKYYKRGKKQKELMPYYIRKYRGMAQLYNFDLFEYVQNRYEILTGKNILKLRWATEEGSSYGRNYALNKIPADYLDGILKNLWNTNRVQYSVDYRFYEMMNLLSIFRYFNIEKGVKYIYKALYANEEPFREWIDVICAEYDKVALVNIPTISAVSFSTRTGKFNFDHVEAKYKTSVSIEKYFSKFIPQHGDQLSQEIKKIEALLDTISS